MRQVNFDAKPASELMDSKRVIQFVALDSDYSPLTPPFCSEGFLSNIMFTEITGVATSINGLTYTKKGLLFSPLRLGVRFANGDRIAPYAENIENLLNKVELEIKNFEGSTVEMVNYEDIVITFSSEWTDQPALLSLFLLLVRIGWLYGKNDPISRYIASYDHDREEIAFIGENLMTILGILYGSSMDISDVSYIGGWGDLEYHNFAHNHSSQIASNLGRDMLIFQYAPIQGITELIHKIRTSRIAILERIVNRGEAKLFPADYKPFSTVAGMRKKVLYSQAGKMHIEAIPYDPNKDKYSKAPKSIIGRPSLSTRGGARVAGAVYHPAITREYTTESLRRFAENNISVSTIGGTWTYEDVIDGGLIVRANSSQPVGLIIERANMIRRDRGDRNPVPEPFREEPDNDDGDLDLDLDIDMDQLDLQLQEQLDTIEEYADHGIRVDKDPTDPETWRYRIGEEIYNTPDLWPFEDFETEVRAFRNAVL